MENQAANTSSTPNLRLAERIALQLFEQGLLVETDRALFVQNFAEGRLREGDWKAALDRKDIPPAPEGELIVG